MASAAKRSPSHARAARARVDASLLRMSGRKAGDRLAIEKHWGYGLAYGVVRVLRGRHKGKLGYYDNETDDGNRGIVYFGTPLGLDYVHVWLKWLRNATAAERRRFEAEHLNDLAYRRGLLKAFGPRPRRP